MVTVPFQTRFQQLRNYKDENGHCHIPDQYPENQPLANWVKITRAEYKKYQQGGFSSLTMEQIKNLDDLGFESQELIRGAHGLNVPWQTHIENLKKYKEANGHCRVPRGWSENRKLANWVNRQRSEYVKHQKGEYSTLTAERIAQLDELGFEWKLSRGGGQLLGIVWQTHIENLKKYKEANSHCRVPQGWSKNRKLGRWVATQRCQYAKHQKGEYSTLTVERIGELDELGFEWKVRTPGGTDVAWQTNVKHLKEYKKANGHCRVSQCGSENRKLGTWVHNQRSQYAKHQKGEYSTLTAERIGELDELGFEWKLGRGSGQLLGIVWQTHIEHLKEYKEANGHCRVPQHWSENRKLAKWVARQRYQYGKLQKGEKSALTAERIAELNELGFEWKLARDGASRNKTPESGSIAGILVPDEQEEEREAENMYQEDEEVQNEVVSSAIVETEGKQSNRPLCCQRKKKKPCSDLDEQPFAKRQRMLSQQAEDTTTETDTAGNNNEKHQEKKQRTLDDTVQASGSVFEVTTHNKNNNEVLLAKETTLEDRPPTKNKKLTLGQRLRAKFEARLEIVIL